MEEFNTLKRQEDHELKNYVSTQNKHIQDQSQAKFREEQLRNLLEDKERNKLLL